MAIKGQFQTISGVDLTEAYVNIPRVEVYKQKVEEVNVFKGGAYVTIYASQTAYEAGKQPVEGKSVTFDLDMESELNPVEQAYVALKGEDIIVGGIDC